MKRITSILFLVLISLTASAQKSRVISATQMMGQGKYEEAKEAIELAVWNDKTSSWARTYYVRGLLCQTAYEEGFEKRDVKKTSLYPDQLYLAYSSYERALELDIHNRLHTNISQLYYHLSNDFRKLGQRLYLSSDYKEAFRAFENALLINNSSLIQAGTDTSLIYNTALAAYESQNWDKAISYLSGLHKMGHDPATSLLLYKALLENGDSIGAEKVLLEGLDIYNYENKVVAYVINLYAQSGRNDLAMAIVQDALKNDPDNYKFMWARGLIYRRMGEREKAIESMKAALELAPDVAKIYYHIGAIYYNMGIDLTELSLKTSNIEKYLELKTAARGHYERAVYWLEKSYEMDPYDDEIISILHQLYNKLQMEEKEEALRLQME